MRMIHQMEQHPKLSVMAYSVHSHDSMPKRNGERDEERGFMISTAWEEERQKSSIDDKLKRPKII